jgi:hypothetical protein
MSLKRKAAPFFVVSIRMQSLKWNRLPVTAAGWYDAIPLPIYHSADITKEPSVSSSGLRMLWRKSPKHFYAKWPYNPLRDIDDEDESDAFTLGRAAHHLYLGEDDFSLSFIERPEKIAGVAWQGNRLECRAFLKQMALAGRTVLKPADVKAIRGMAKSLAAEPEAIDLLQGAVEQTLIARDPDTGIWLKARPDVIPSADGIYADLKTTVSTADLDLKGSLRSYAYHQQGALIWEVCEMLGLPFDGFALVFVEKTSPYCVRVIEVPDEDLALGRMQNRAMLRLMSVCMKAGQWPGPGREPGEYFGISKAETEYIETRLKVLDEQLKIAEAA